MGEHHDSEMLRLERQLRSWRRIATALGIALAVVTLTAGTAISLLSAQIGRYRMQLIHATSRADAQMDVAMKMWAASENARAPLHREGEQENTAPSRQP